MFLPSIISDPQSAFMHRTLITDNILVAFETMQHISHKKDSLVGEMALKLDMRKAYDRVEWVCLDKSMKKLGLNSKWRKLMMQCISTMNYSVRINVNLEVVSPLLGVYDKGAPSLLSCFYYVQKGS